MYYITHLQNRAEGPVSSFFFFFFPRNFSNPCGERVPYHRHARRTEPQDPVLVAVHLDTPTHFARSYRNDYSDRGRVRAAVYRRQRVAG